MSQQDIIQQKQFTSYIVPVYLHLGMVRKDVVNAYYKGDWEPRTTFRLSGFGVGWHYDVGMQAVRMIASGV